MGSLNIIKNKMKLIYTSKLTISLLSIQILFLIIYMCTSESRSIIDYTGLLRNDLVLWLIFIPLLLAEHKVCIFTTYYNFISRICYKNRMIFNDYITIAISTCVSAGLVLLVPLFLYSFFINEACDLKHYFFVIMGFLFFRYVLIGLLVQYVAYSLVYSFAIFQKRGGMVCTVPFFLYPLFMLPMEFLSANGKYFSILDFSAGRNYIFTADANAFINSVLLNNIHLLGYLVAYIWVSSECFARKWEFFENDVDEIC